MKIIAALTTLLLTGSALAQGTMQMGSASGDDHMIEFNANTLLNGVLSLEKSKVRGKDSDNSFDVDITANYAYRLPMLRLLQVGGGVNYFSGTEAGRGDVEDYGFNVAAFLNSSEDLKNSFYLSAKWGVDWAHTYGGANGNTKDEVGTIQFGLGKRADLSQWGIKNLTYTPEVAFVNKDSSTRSSLEYAQSLEFRFLQFALFF